MGRPPDNYTHDQFEPIPDANSVEGTVRCIHCKIWTGSIRPLNRKKDHLRTCQAYAAWRAAGNGQDIPPANPYNSSKRMSGTAEYVKSDTYLTIALWMSADARSSSTASMVPFTTKTTLVSHPLGCETRFQVRFSVI